MKKILDFVYFSGILFGMFLSNLVVYIMKRFLSYYIKSFNEPIECSAYEDDLENLRTLIEKGDPKSHYNLGCIYEGGIGLHKDYNKAARWYRSAAELGSAEAQLRLGLMYLQYDYKLTTPQIISHRTAFDLFYRSAVQGNAAAENKLGDMYSSGLGVERDCHEAIYWYRRAAIQGNPDSHLRLSVFYKNGAFFKKNMMTSYIFEVLCSRYGNHERHRICSQLSSQKELSFSQAKEARVIAKNWHIGKPLTIFEKL